MSGAGHATRRVDWIAGAAATDAKRFDGKYVEVWPNALRFLLA